MRQRFIFFFSSRRRHTRSLCDWSSDVCSSDLCIQHLEWEMFRARYLGVSAPVGQGTQSLCFGGLPRGTSPTPSPFLAHSFAPAFFSRASVSPHAATRLIFRLKSNLSQRPRQIALSICEHGDLFGYLGYFVLGRASA